jgi:hypothetical protein
MPIGPTQGDEKRFPFSNVSPWKSPSPLCHLDRSAAKWRDLRFLRLQRTLLRIRARRESARKRLRIPRALQAAEKPHAPFERANAMERMFKTEHCRRLTSR